jgi:hypothetical protein
MSPTDPPSEFGCARCYGEDAERTWGYYPSLPVEQELVDDSHFIVQLRRCPRCSQRFVWIFTEFVDWEHGDDAQHRAIVPVTAAEAKALKRQGADVDLAYLGALGRDRRYLKTDWPTGQPNKTVGWAAGGLFIVPGH